MQGMRNYQALTPGVHYWNGNFSVGHGVILHEKGGWKVWCSGTRYFCWALKGDTSIAILLLGMVP